MLQQAHVDAQDKALNDVAQILGENEAKLSRLELALKEANDKLKELQQENASLRQESCRLRAGFPGIFGRLRIQIHREADHV